MSTSTRWRRWRNHDSDRQRSDDAALRPLALLLRLKSLNRARRFEECSTIGEQTLSTLTWNEGDALQLAGVHAELSVAFWALSRDRERVLHHAWKAIELDKGQATAAEAIRSLNGAFSPTARRMTVMVEGLWPERFDGSDDLPGFYATYEVVAEDADEALSFLRPFEPEGARSTLAVAKCTVREAAVDEPKGVVAARRGYTFWVARRPR